MPDLTWQHQAFHLYLPFSPVCFHPEILHPSKWSHKPPGHTHQSHIWIIRNTPASLSPTLPLYLINHRILLNSFANVPASLHHQGYNPSLSHHNQITLLSSLKPLNTVHYANDEVPPQINYTITSGNCTQALIFFFFNSPWMVLICSHHWEVLAILVRAAEVQVKFPSLVEGRWWPKH